MSGQRGALLGLGNDHARLVAAVGGSFIPGNRGRELLRVGTASGREEVSAERGERSWRDERLTHCDGGSWTHMRAIWNRQGDHVSSTFRQGGQRNSLLSDADHGGVGSVGGGRILQIPVIARVSRSKILGDVGLAARFFVDGQPAASLSVQAAGPLTWRRTGIRRQPAPSSWRTEQS